MGGSSASSESHGLKIGLKFGQKIYFEAVGVGVEAKSDDALSPAGGGGPQKKGRQQQPPRCQVEGCNVDLSDAKTYYSRHKVCGAHSKTPMVIVNGLEQRFCQQCSRFHRLPEFDQGKRSCRRRLAGHNERRRKPPPGTMISARYGSLSSSNFENSRAGGFVMDFSTCSEGRVQWSNRRASTRVEHNLPTAIEKSPPLPWQSNLDNPPPFVNPSVLIGVSNSNRALSLLSNQFSGSRNQTLSLECYVNPAAGAHMIQPADGNGNGNDTNGVTTGHFSSTASWGYDANETYLGLCQVLQSGYSGEPGLSQQSARRYDSSVEHVHW